MRWFTKELGSEDHIEFWGLAGLLHDVDFELFPQHHCIKASQILTEAHLGDDLIHAVCSH